MEGVGAKKEGESLPPGFRFHPTDEELITYYLTHRISEPNFDARAVADVDLNKCEPWDLPGKAKMGEKEWYFFSLRDRKYPTGVRTNRATTAGYWKTTGKDKEIYNSETSELVGMKKTLVFYKGRAPRGEKSNWVMHEYRLQSRPTYKPNKDEWVVCRVFMKRPGAKKYTTQPRATNPYTIDMSNAAMMPNGLMHATDPYTHFGVSRSHHLTHADLVELARFAKGQQGYNMPIQPQPSFSNNYTLSGLNLNVGSLQQQQPQQQPPQQQVLFGGYSGEMGTGNDSSNVGNNAARFQNVECVDLEGYWPTY